MTCLRQHNYTLYNIIIMFNKEKQAQKTIKVFWRKVVGNLSDLSL